MRLDELLAMATPQQREAFKKMWLGYTETWGASDLREAVASIYEHQTASNVLCFAGASEGIFAANTVLLDPDSHAVVVTPNYQSHESLPATICEATGVPLNPDDNWSLDLDRVAAAIRPNTRLVTINFPHNPTGAILPLDHYQSLIKLCREHGIYILHDEIFNGLGPTGRKHLPFIADLYERGLSPERHVEILRPAGIAHRLDRLSKPRGALEDGTAETLFVDLQFRPERAVSRHRLGKTAQKSSHVTARSSMRTCPNGIPSSPAIRPSLNGGVQTVPAWPSRVTSVPRVLRNSPAH